LQRLARTARILVADVAAGLHHERVGADQCFVEDRGLDDILINGVYVVCDVLLSWLRSQMFLIFDAQTDVIELRVRVDDIKIASNTVDIHMHVHIYM
jgi:hypothetical protein